MGGCIVVCVTEMESEGMPTAEASEEARVVESSEAGVGDVCTITTCALRPTTEEEVTAGVVGKLVLAASPELTRLAVVSDAEMASEVFTSRRRTLPLCSPLERREMTWVEATQL